MRYIDKLDEEMIKELEEVVKEDVFLDFLCVLFLAGTFFFTLDLLISNPIEYILRPFKVI